MTFRTNLRGIVLGAAVLALSGCASAPQSDAVTLSGPTPYTTSWSGVPTAQQYVALPSGNTLRVLRTGDGPPLVLMHTIRTQLDYFQRLIPLLSKNFTVYAIDLPGHGQSSQQSVEYTEPYFRKVVSEFLVQQNLQDTTLVGESIGGVLALTVAAEQPGRIKRVVSLNPYDYGDEFGGGIRRSSSGWMVGLFNVFGKHTIEPRFVTNAVLRGGFHEPDRLPADLVDEFSRSGYRDGYRAIEYSVFKNWQTWIEARQLYARVKAPVTIVYGSHDWSSQEDRERNRAALPKAQFVTVEAAGHFTSLEKPQEVAKAVLTPASGS